MASPKIIFYSYSFSPYAQKVKAYLAFRKIEYTDCVQPHILPRPDVALLGINYRRIPLLAIGKDVYIDTRAIIRRLDELFPPSAQHPGLASPKTDALGKLLHEFIGNPGGVFTRAVGQITPEFGAAKDPAFQKDRSELLGPKYFKDGWKDANKEGLTHMRHAFSIIESLLQDGRQWIGATDSVSEADLHSQWVFRWYLTDLKAPKEYFNDQQYPKTFAWIARYEEALKAAIKSNPKAPRVKGEEALDLITSAEYTDTAVEVDGRDPLQLPANTYVAVFPTDGGGHGHQDHGTLVRLDRYEVAVQLKASNGKELRLHAPRWNYRIKAAQPEKAQL